MLKEPFARARILEDPSAYSRAFRAWDLLEEAEFPQDSSKWQYHAPRTLQHEAAQDEPHVAAWSHHGFALDAHHERGFFGYFACAVRRCVCGDPAVRARVEESLQRSGRPDFESTAPEAIVASGGATLGDFWWKRSRC